MEKGPGKSSCNLTTTGKQWHQRRQKLRDAGPKHKLEIQNLWDLKMGYYFKGGCLVLQMGVITKWHNTND